MRRTRSWSQLGPAGVLLLAVAAACEHTPPEDFPARQAASVASEPRGAAVQQGAVAPTAAPASKVAPVPTVAAPAPAEASAAAARCVVPTPAQPPPAVAPGPAPGCPPDPEAAPPATPTARVVFPGAPGTSGTSVDVEVVRSPHDTQRGLMYRKALADGRGMLFDLGTREDHQFWMHHTCIPLDLIYIDSDGLIVGIVENAPTLDDRARGVGCPSTHVLEVNAGWSRRHGVKAGQFVKLP